MLAWGLGHRRHHPRAVRLHTPAGEASLRHPRKAHDPARLRARAPGPLAWTACWWPPTTSASPTRCAAFGGRGGDDVAAPRLGHRPPGRGRARPRRRRHRGQRAGRRADARPRRHRRRGVGASSDPGGRDGDGLPAPARRGGDAVAERGEGGDRRRAGDALYFSRSPIPYVRRRRAGRPASAAAAVAQGLARRHVGLYGYRREALLRFAGLAAGAAGGGGGARAAARAAPRHGASAWWRWRARAGWRWTRRKTWSACARSWPGRAPNEGDGWRPSTSS